MDFLYHHGIIGQKWGVRRFQNKDGSLTDEGRRRYGKSEYKKFIDKKDRTYNLDKWGSSQDTNILMITGLSGSGKSTLAKNLAKKSNADIISLDYYYEDIRNTKNQSNGFNKYLEKYVPDFTKIKNNFSYYEKVRFKSEKANDDCKFYWKTMDLVRDAMFEYAKEQYPNRMVISEGVQLLDSAMYPTIDAKAKAISGKPFIIKGTSGITSNVRAAMRDNVIVSATFIQSILKSNKAWNDQIKQTEKILRGKEYVNEVIHNH